MLTAFQCATGAYLTEDGDLLCEDCFRSEDSYAKPVSNYGLDEEQSYAAEGWLDWDFEDGERRTVNGKDYLYARGIWHVEACGCEPALIDANGHELREPYIEPSCGEDEPNEPDDPALD